MNRVHSRVEHAVVSVLAAGLLDLELERGNLVDIELAATEPLSIESQE